MQLANVMHVYWRRRAEKPTLAFWTLTGRSRVLNHRAMSSQRSGVGCAPSAASKASTRTLNFSTLSWYHRCTHKVTN